jgi:hypothetical protein
LRILFMPWTQSLFSRFTCARRAIVTTPRKYTTGKSTRAKATKPDPKSSAWATSASATTAPESAAMNIDARLIDSV